MLVVSAARPLVTVITVKDVTTKEPFDVPPERVKSSDVPKGQEVVERPGTPGERTISEQQTWENHRVVKRTILQQTITSEPVAKRVLVGPPANAPSPPPTAKGH